MAEETSSNVTGPTQKPITPMGSSQSDHPSLMITTVKLDGRNYLAWSQSARMFIGSRRKCWYITGSKKEPPADDPSHEDWESDNLTVMSWLLHSMQPTISEGLLFLRTAKEIWDTVQEMYSQRNSLARNYQLHREIATMQQGEMSMEEYYAALKKKWEELDHYQPLATTVEGIRKQNEQRRIFEYLAGLRSEYELQRVQVLGKDT